MLFVTGIIVSIFAAPSWQTFDAEHPKRILCLYMENITSHDLTLHMAGIDAAQTLFSNTMLETAIKMGLTEKPIATDMGTDIPDWDIVSQRACNKSAHQANLLQIYPVNQFVQSYRIPLPPLDASYESPFKDSLAVEVLESKLNAVKQTRQLTIAVRHPGVIWTGPLPL